ncbi:unnamed protein product [Sphagnum jensenii]|uniref:ABM domain-containing protein n=1 Tax=Sphagnum jensenii TaxID=128206 RepID=A0ABP0WRY9_9BRYO
MATTSCSQSLVFASSHVSSSSSSASSSSSSLSLSARNALANCSTTSATASSVRRASSTRGRRGGGGFQKGSHLGTTFVVRECRRVAPFKYRAGGLVVEAAKRVASGRSYVLSSTLKIQEGNEEEVSSLCKSILQWAVEKQTDKKSGIQCFECNVDPFEKNVFHFWERYESFQAMNDTRASLEHTKFMTDVRPLLIGPIGLAVYEYKDGQIGHMMNPIGPKGEGGLDDATGQSGSKQQSSAMNQGLGDTTDREQWGLQSMLDKVIGKEKQEKAEKAEKVEGWSLKTLFGVGKK